MTGRRLFGKLISSVGPACLPAARAVRREGPLRVLLIRPDHIGDVLFTTPALRLLRAQLPDAHIAYLVGPWARRVLEHNHNVDDVLVCDFPWFNRRPPSRFWQRYATLFDTARALSRYEFDVAINLRFDFWWGAVLADLLRVPRRVGYAHPDCAPFLTDTIDRTQPLHEVEQNLMLIEALLSLPGYRSPNQCAVLACNDDAPVGAVPEPPLPEPEPQRFARRLSWDARARPLSLWERARVRASPKYPQTAANGWQATTFASEPGASYHLDFFVTPDEESFVAKYLAQRGIVPHDTLVAIHPGSGGHLKQWTASGFAVVARELQRKHRAKILLTGSAAERRMAEGIAEEAGGHCWVMAGDTTLGQLVATFRRCRLVVGVDSGPLHLAAASCTPTVHLFGPSDHLAFGPCGDARLHRCVRADFPCSPCGRMGRPYPADAGGDCMLAITPEAAFQAVEDVLAESTSTADTPGGAAP